MTSYRSSHLNKGDDYDELFVQDTRTSITWSLEQRAIREIVAGTKTPFRHLDFACGTGRFLQLLSPYARTSTGIDVSESMMEVARRKVPTAEFIVADITHDNVLAGRQFDVITAFRFFPNAEATLRHEVFPVLANLLAPGGILIFNNHLNSTSGLRRLMALKRMPPGHTMSELEVKDLVSSAHLRISEDLGLGVFPLPGKYVRFPRLISRVEWASRKAPWRSLGTDRLYVARKA